MMSGIPLPKVVADVGPGGPLVTALGGMNALQASYLANTMAQLKNQQQQYQNQITAPYAQMANPFAQAALKLAQVRPDLVTAQAKQATANAGYLGSETDINKFKITHPAYLNAEGYLYSTPIGEATGGTSAGGDAGGTVGSQGATINEHGVIMPSDSGSAMPSAPASPSVSSAPSSSAQPQTNAINAAPGSPSTASVNSLTTIPNIINSATKQPKTIGQAIMQGRIAQVQAAQARAQTVIKKNNAYAYSMMSPDQKSQVAAVLNGAGIDQYDAMNELSAGKTPNQILAERGINPSDVKPISLLTSEDRKLFNQKKAAISAVNTLGPIVRDGLSPYIQAIHGRSPKQIADAISGDDPEKQIKFLEAYGISPDLAAMRGQAIGLRMGKGILDELSTKMLANIEPFQAFVKPEIYAEAQKRIDQDVTNAGNASIDAVNRSGSAPSSSSTTGKKWVYNKSKGLLE